MDKILRRVHMAERQVARRAKRRQALDHSMATSKTRQAVMGMRQEAGYDLGVAIKRRHEDRNLGPIAPSRDVAMMNPYGQYWGSISTERALLQTKLTKEQRDARAAWAGGPEYLCLKVGDRVVIIEGPYKGKISTIGNLKKETMTVELDDNVAIVNVHVPQYLQEDNKPPVQLTKSVVPISAVRLVHPLTDPETGTTRDVIVRELKPVNITHDRPTRRVFYSRIIPGLNVRIPWPKYEPPRHEDHPSDTLRLDVEERTFVPTLLRPPMPEAVLDELRNKYGKFRKRHTPEYIAEVEAREAAKKAQQKGARAGEMLLPVQEYNRKMRELRRERGKPELSEEMLEKIGEVIVRNRLVRSAGEATAAAEVDTVQKAVEELSLGGDDAPPATGGEQPRA